MVSNRDRQRAAARARLEQKMAERAELAHRRRRTQTLIGAAAGALVLLVGVVWLVVAVASSDDPKKNKTVASGCVWNPLTDPNDPSASPAAGTRDVGTPDKDVPRSGRSVMTMNTNLGVIEFEMDASKAPCAVASFKYLASKQFYDGTKCHRLVPSITALQCGDPVGDGTGGPSYRYDEENTPGSDVKPAYPQGSVAVAKAQQKGTNGSQFFFVYGASSQLPGDYTLLGTVTKGLDIIQKIGEGGHDGSFDEGGSGRPKTELVLQKVTVSAAGENTQPAPSGTPAASSPAATEPSSPLAS